VGRLGSDSPGAGCLLPLWGLVNNGFPGTVDERLTWGFRTRPDWVGLSKSSRWHGKTGHCYASPWRRIKAKQTHSPRVPTASSKPSPAQVASPPKSPATASLKQPNTFSNARSPSPPSSPAARASPPQFESVSSTRPCGSVL